MTSTRGKAKMDLHRAKVLARHLAERMSAIHHHYEGFEQFALGCEVVIKIAQEAEKLVETLEKNLP